MQQNKIDNKIKGIAVIIWICLWFPVCICHAWPLTVEFTAEVIEVYESDDFLEGKVEVGDTINGTYSYDTSMPSSMQFVWYYYSFNSPPAGISVQVGGFEFKTDPNDIELVIAVENDSSTVLAPRDSFRLDSSINIMLCDDILCYDNFSGNFSIYLGNYYSTALLSYKLPASAPNLSDWMARGIEFSGGVSNGSSGGRFSTGKGFHIKGRLTSAALVSEPPQIIYVDDDAPGANNGSSWENAYTFLQDALTDANDSNKPVEIRVAQGIYRPDMGAGQTPGDREATFNLINQVAIEGGYAGLSGPNPDVQNIQLYKTILSGDLNGDDLPGFANRNDNSYHVLSAIDVDESAYIEGFIITSGSADGLPVNNPDPLQRQDNHTIRGGGLYVFDGQPTVESCIFKDNYTYGYGGGLYLYGASRIFNCNFTGNKAEYTGGAVYFSEEILSENDDRFFSRDMLLKGCLLQGNTAAVGVVLALPERDGSIYLYNCTIADNGLKYERFRGINYTNCIIWNQEQGMYGLLPFNLRYSDICNTEGVISFPDDNISEDPLFIAPGYWDTNGTPDDPNDDFWIEGDYHLKSQAGRWDPNSQSWIQDDVTSPCIDAGDPMSPIGLEPFPNGGRINMGAYGGTAEASKSYFGESLCETIVAGDINGDCKVDFKDFALMSLHWLEN